MDAERRKITRFDNIQTEILKHGGPGIIDAVNVLWQKNLDQCIMAQRLDKITNYSSSNGRQHTSLSELQKDPPDLSP